jgi:hypothetical protein
VKTERVPYLETDPPIDFRPRLRSVAGAVEIQSGFLKVTINRHCITNSYSPSDAHRPIYRLAGDVLALLGRRNLFEPLGITPQQAERLYRLSPPPDRPVDRGWTQLYIAYKDAPAGPLHAEAAEDLGDAIRTASQDYHAAHAAFAEGAKTILTAAQLARLSGALKGAAGTANPKGQER